MKKTQMHEMTHETFEKIDSCKACADSEYDETSKGCAPHGHEYLEAFDPVAYINEPRWHYSSLGLERISLLLEKLGNPQNRVRCVHVAGTNGKGSTCAYVSGVLRATGLRVGLFTSPYIERFEERIQINGCNICADNLRAVTLVVRNAAAEVEAEQGEHPTEFELMAAVAFVHFARAACDVAVVEVGLGGRLDATNVVRPEVCVIARIGLDHTVLLGDTLEAIATEKAGIIKAGVPVVSWPQESAAMEVIERMCEQQGCELTCPDFTQLQVSEIDGHTWMRSFSYKGRAYQTRLLAPYQPANAAVAIEAFEALARAGFFAQRATEGEANKLAGAYIPSAAFDDVLDSTLRAGIAATTWPGRFEVVSCDPLIVIDGAHNPQGARALADALVDLVRGADETRGKVAGGVQGETAGSTRGETSGSFTFVMGVLADKDYEHIIAPLVPHARRFVTYAPSSPRALGAEELARAIYAQAPQAEVVACSSPAEALDLALHANKPSAGEGIVACGTLYAIGALKQALREKGYAL